MPTFDMLSDFSIPWQTSMWCHTPGGDCKIGMIFPSAKNASALRVEERLHNETTCRKTYPIVNYGVANSYVVENEIE